MRIETGEYMKIRHILKITYMEINQHLFNFIITTFMLGVSFGLLFISFTVLVCIIRPCFSALCHKSGLL